MPAYGFQSCGQYDVCQFGTVGECIGPDILYLCLYGQGCHFGCSVESGVVYFGDDIVAVHERYFFRNRDFTCICSFVGCLDSVGVGFAVDSCMGDSDRRSLLRSVFDHIGHIFARENISRIYGDGLFSEILEIAPACSPGISICETCGHSQFRIFIYILYECVGCHLRGIKRQRFHLGDVPAIDGLRADLLH